MNKIHILIVEDSRTQLERLKNILEEGGFQVTSAQNGEEALSLLNSIKVNLIISDIVMPKMDGYQLAKMLRVNPTFQDLPIILLTTLSETEDIIRGLECGANYFITKPYKEDYLLRHVNAAMNIHKMRLMGEENNHVKILLNGKEHLISAAKSQVLDLLVSIYDAAIQKNSELRAVQLQLHELNNALERKVDERTAALRVEIEERKRFEMQFLQAQKMESIAQLAGGIAHDFNNLLMIIQGDLELIQMDMSDNQNNPKRLKESLETLHRGKELIKRLLSFSRHQQLQPKLLDLSDVISNTIQLLKPMLGVNIEIKSQLEKNLWPVWLDISQFENAIVNLAINARDAMNGKGGLTIGAYNLTVDESMIKKRPPFIPGNFVRISITDTGKGIPSEYIDHVFEPFFTTKEPGKGTGLGLSMVYGFVKQSNGYVTIDSQLDVGTTINLFFPKADEIQILLGSKTPVSNHAR